MEKSNVPRKSRYHSRGASQSTALSKNVDPRFEGTLLSRCQCITKMRGNEIVRKEYNNCQLSDEFT